MSALEPVHERRTTPPAAGGRDLLLWEVRDRFPARRTASVDVSLVAPVFEEEANLERLHARVVEIFGMRTAWELVLVDDGSKDRSAQLIRDLARRDPRVIGVFFGRNRGQTAATAAGVHLARGRLIATLDADLQNDPADLPKMIELIEGHDAVVGWRMKRRDTFIRRISSKIANGIRNWISKDSIRDTGCSLKVFRAEAIQAIPLFEGMHRFLPTLMRYHGFSVIEHGVNHHPRTAGISKYGVWNRAFRALKDLFAVRWMRARLLRLPIQEVTDAR
ncbi:MAG: glycosyltransferase family 2 protein [Planctomycetota bacterium]|nr:glycosyltransferase family 2 protein [Planctomycetota bacterium]